MFSAVSRNRGWLLVIFSRGIVPYDDHKSVAVCNGATIIHALVNTPLSSARPVALPPALAPLRHRFFIPQMH